MANFTAGTSFSDGVTNDVTAAKLNALVADAVPTSNLSLNSTTGTIANFTASTANITLGTIPTLTAGTTTGTAAIFTSGTITTLNSTTPTFLGAITASTNTINVGSGQIYKDASGRVGIGTSSPSSAYRASLTGDGSSITGGLALNTNSNLTYVSAPSAVSADFEIFNSANGYVRIGTNNTERLRITSGGYLKASDAGTYVNSAATYHELRNSAAEVTLLASNSNIVPQGIQIRFTSAPNDATSQFLNCNDGNGITNRAIIRSNGGIQNYQANDGNLSDERLKTDIQPSPSYLDKICSIPVVNFKYKDQTHDDYNLGAIAQQVESVCPELVDADGVGETPEDGIPIKAIYQTDLQYALMKCIQELKSENDSLKSRIEALEAK
jgi:hypothetical protein